MALGPIELHGTIARTQDYSQIKHQEDQKGLIDQSNFLNQFRKEIKERPHQVNHADNADFHERKFDAKEKGSNEYAGDGGKDRKRPKGQDGQVLLKERKSFDVKI